MKKTIINQQEEVNFGKITVENENNGDRNTTLSIEKYATRIRPYLKTSQITSQNLITGKFS